MSIRLFAFSALALVLGALSGCASPDSNKPKPPANPEKEKVSTIPWNKPASWEGQGQLGGMGSAFGSGR